MFKDVLRYQKHVSSAFKLNLHVKVSLANVQSPVVLRNEIITSLSDQNYTVNLMNASTPTLTTTEAELTGSSRSCY